MTPEGPDEGTSPRVRYWLKAARRSTHPVSGYDGVGVLGGHTSILGGVVQVVPHTTQAPRALILADGPYRLAGNAHDELARFDTFALGDQCGGGYNAVVTQRRIVEDGSVHPDEHAIT